VSCNNPQGRVKSWPINRLNEKNAEVRIYTDIGYWYTSQMFVDQLDGLRDVEVLDVRINSFGGFASEGVAMYNALVRHPAKKRVWIDAAAYSAASIVAMAASPGELRIAFNARLMIHNAWNMAEGDHRDMEKAAGILKMLDGTLAATYAKRATAVSKEEFLALMAAETWYDADAAVAAGLADEAFDAGAVELPESDLNLVREFKRPPADLIEKMQARSAAKGELPGRGPSPLAAGVEVAARWAEIRNRNAAA